MHDSWTPRYFQNVVLVSCASDSYGPFDSARAGTLAQPLIALPPCGDFAKVEIGNMLGMHTSQQAYQEIVQNLWKNVQRPAFAGLWIPLR